uniref:Uncharacterized protein LOC102804186 n=1 Tax=Saccoglossus kowalevskii TaxID=10224 RepID=A0ABM0LWA8_SACKO|nr:PREDICTED: uncharacterized protein LOC102804186 [Saccoglossus kowalevskii]
MTAEEGSTGASPTQSPDVSVTPEVITKAKTEDPGPDTTLEPASTMTAEKRSTGPQFPGLTTTYSLTTGITSPENITKAKTVEPGTETTLEQASTMTAQEKRTIIPLTQSGDTITYSSTTGNTSPEATTKAKTVESGTDTTLEPASTMKTEEKSIGTPPTQFPGVTMTHSSTTEIISPLATTKATTGEQVTASTLTLVVRSSGSPLTQSSGMSVISSSTTGIASPEVTSDAETVEPVSETSLEPVSTMKSLGKSTNIPPTQSPEYNCPDPELQPPGRFDPMVTFPADPGTILYIQCQEPLTLFGSSNLTCNGMTGTWSDETPICSSTSTVDVTTELVITDIGNKTQEELEETILEWLFEFETSEVEVKPQLIHLEMDNDTAIVVIVLSLNETDSLEIIDELLVNVSKEIEGIVITPGELEIVTSCHVTMCDNGGICTNESRTSCSCPNGYFGTFCELQELTTILPGTSRLTATSTPVKPTTTIFTTVIGCPDLELDNSIIYDPAVTFPAQFGTTIYFSCPPNMILVGPSNLTCDSTIETWDGDTPICLNGCDELELPDNSQIADGYTLPVQTGDFVMIECDSNYTMYGNDTIRCQLNGEWSELPTCEVITCGRPVMPYDGFLLGRIKFPVKVGRTVEYACNDSFELVGPIYTTCNATLQDWDQDHPYCVDEDIGTVEVQGEILITEIDGIPIDLIDPEQFPDPQDILDLLNELFNNNNVTGGDYIGGEIIDIHPRGPYLVVDFILELNSTVTVDIVEQIIEEAIEDGDFGNFTVDPTFFAYAPVCPDNFCENDGNCTIHYANRTLSCRCTEGFTGRYCEEEVKVVTVNVLSPDPDPLDPILEVAGGIAIMAAILSCCTIPMAAAVFRRRRNRQKKLIQELHEDSIYESETYSTTDNVNISSEEYNDDYSEGNMYTVDLMDTGPNTYPVLSKGNFYDVLDPHNIK